jgi:hypothetical protein
VQLPTFLENGVFDDGILEFDIVTFNFAINAGQGSFTLFIVVAFGVVRW